MSPRSFLVETSKEERRASSDAARAWRVLPSWLLPVSRVACAETTRDQAETRGAPAGRFGGAAPYCNMPWLK